MEWQRFRTRNKRRSFACSDGLWKEILSASKGCISISKFIRDAVEEKMEKVL